MTTQKAPKTPKRRKPTPRRKRAKRKPNGSRALVVIEGGYRSLEDPDARVSDTGGRPHGLTQFLADRIASEVRLGATPREAAAVCGVPESTWYGWLREHRDGVQPSAALIGGILLAEASFIAATEQQLASAPEWQAQAFILKSRRRAIYGDKVEVTKQQEEEPQRIGLTRQELIEEAEKRGLPTTIFGD